MGCNCFNPWKANSSCRRSSPHLTVTDGSLPLGRWPQGKPSLTTFSLPGLFESDRGGVFWVSFAGCGGVGRLLRRRHRMSPAAVSTGPLLSRLVMLSAESWEAARVLVRTAGSSPAARPPHPPARPRHRRHSRARCRSCLPAARG